MTVVLTGDWKAMDDIFKTLPRRIQKNLRLATKKNTKVVERRMKLGIRNQRPEWERLKEGTIRQKGSSKILIDYGDLMNSYTTKELLATVFFVGVERNAKNKDGESLFSIALQQEFGSHDGSTPARANIRPSLDESERECQKNWEKSLDASLKGLVYA